MIEPIHPLSRQHLRYLKQYPIVANFINGITNRINTHPYFLDYSLYPDLDHKELKLKFLEYLLLEYKGIEKIDSTNLLFTCGASEAIELVIKSFCEPGYDIICVTPPTFSLYEELSKRHNCAVSKISLLGDNFDLLDIPKILSLNPKVLFLCSPNNPVGTMLCSSEIEQLSINLPHSLIVVDETYIDFAFGQELLILIEKHSNIIIIRSFSKGWGLAGIRAGLIISNNLIINTLRLMQLPFSFSSPAQENVLNGLKNLKQRRKYLKEIIKAREKISFILSEEIQDIIKVYPSSANFITVSLINSNSYIKHLNKNKMLVTDIREIIPDSIRLSIYNAEYNDCLISTLKGLHKSSI